MTQLHRHHHAAASCVAWMFLATSLTLGSAASCPDTGEPAPTVVTLMASKTNPKTDAWVVTPNCKVETIKCRKAGDDLALDLSAKGIERIVSVPEQVWFVTSTGNALSQGVDFSKATWMFGMQIIDSTIASNPGSLLLPTTTLNSVSFKDNSALTLLDNIKFPDKLESLSLLNTPNLKTLKNARLPARLNDLTISTSKVTAADLQYIPTAVSQLIFVSSPIGNLDRVSMPIALSMFVCDDCGIKVVRGVKWPSTLKRLIFTDTISTFEVRQSDLETLQKLEDFIGTINQATCANAGVLKEVKGLKLCVISDSAFESLYVNNASSSDESKGDSSEPSKATDGSKDTKESDTSSPPSETKPTRGSGGGSLQGSSSGSLVGSGSLNSGIRPSGLGPGRNASSPSSVPQDTPTDVTAGTGSSMSSSTLVVIILSCALSLALAAVIYQVIVGRKKRKQQHDGAETPSTESVADKFDLAYTPSTSSDSNKETTAWGIPTSSSLPIDIQNDSDLVRWRIGQVHVGKQIARGGYGVVYKGSHHNRIVAIKQMLPDAWKSDSMTAAFVDEIRLCARLEHPKIVSFIGVSWTSLRDLSVVTEYMAGGDLYSLLRKYPESSGREWSDLWSREHLRTKTLIAMDVAEAVVYLHSFDSPIIHRDLKAKNVLLDPVGNAKLSDFGISRTVSMDETMTSEIGTAAWIAPEVLRGERYSEKADIYSLGVLLVELDRCRHPYAEEPVLLMGSSTHRGDVGRGNTSHVAHKNTQIAVLVSTGKLRPSPSRGCPDDVAGVIGHCLSFEASERPTAMEVFYELRQIRKKHDTGDDIGYTVV